MAASVKKSAGSRSPVATAATSLQCENGRPPRAAIDIDAFLFDVDGVLADTADLHAAAWEAAAGEAGLPFDPAVALQLRGRSREDSLRAILRGRPISQERFTELMRRKNNRYVASLASLTPDDALPGVVRLLDELSADGFALAAVSASRNARTVLDRLGLSYRFVAIIDGATFAAEPATDSTNRRSPDRSNINRYLFAAAAIGCDPRRCVAVEDSAAGIALARSAGMCTIGLGDAASACGADVEMISLEGLTRAGILSALRLAAQKVGASRPQWTCPRR